MADVRFRIDGKLTVLDSATVICLRRRPVAKGDEHATLQRSCFRQGHQDRTALDGLFAGLEEMDFSTGWEVLLGQAECVNWLRSVGPHAEQLHTMRYPGEFKLAGGNVDDGESFLAAARRELEEEFLRPAGMRLPSNARLRPFSVKQTLPVRSKSNLMWNFVALEDENLWLAELDVSAVNARLADGRRRFQGLLDSGEFWQMSREERERVAPEVREMRWVPLGEAVRMALMTMVAAGTGNYVNEYQRVEFHRLGIKRRDPMFMTGVTLLELESFPEEAELLRRCELLEQGDGMARERKTVQWLFDGMTAEDLPRLANEPKEMVKKFPEVLRLRETRRRHARSRL